LRRPFLTVILEIKSSEETEHQLCEECYISLAALKHIVLGDTVHAAGDEVHDEYAVIVGNVTDEMLAFEERLILHVIEKMDHAVPHQKLYDMSVIHDISAVALAE